MATIIATPGSAAANSYCTLAEAEAYFATRTLLAGWDNADDKSVLLIMATRTLDANLRPMQVYVPATSGIAAHYITRRTWTGRAATTVQKLAWPRSGMSDANGNAISEAVIPADLKDATAEFAGQLGAADLTLDNDVIVQGITSLRAGSVSLGFKDFIQRHVVPDAVLNLMPPSWFTGEIITSALAAEFDVVSY